VRVYATGLFGFVTMFRPDVGGLVSKYLPALEKRYTDPVGKVRSNAVSAVINIKPRPPVEAAEALVGALEDSRTQTCSDFPAAWAFTMFPLCRSDKAP
jgi:hypothetical protein